MNIINISDPDILVKEIYKLPNSYVFRGQSNASWALESSLERLLKDSWTPEEVRKYEDYSLQIFQPKFHLFDTENQRPDSKFAWLSIMQHYGVPTRLIDFTQSPIIALFFALETYDFKEKTPIFNICI